MIINPSTGKEFEKIPDVILTGTVALHIARKKDSEDVTFNCPYCQKRNNQNTKSIKQLLEKHIAVFRCNKCYRLVDVQKKAVGTLKTNIIEPGGSHAIQQCQ